MSENEKKQLFNNLSDAIKECQLRFGGKRELATEVDGRVCFLCQKLEAIFMHGLKKPNSSTLSNTSGLQIIKNNNIIKSTGNLLSQFFDDTKLPIPNNAQPEITFWSFVKNFMNKFDIERFELLGNIKTDVGRQRAWIRNCLNEHCIERYTLAILSNRPLLSQYYEESCFLLDKNYTSTVPMLLSGLQSILFAINIDNPNLNIQSKLATSSTTTNGHGESKGNQPIQINSTGDETTTSTSNLSTSFSGNSLANAETTTIKLKKKSSFTSPNNVTNAITSNLRKIKKSNVVVFDDDTTVVDDSASAGRALMTTSNDLDTMNKNDDSRTNSSSNLDNQFVFANDDNGVDSLNHKEPVIKTNSYSNIGAASNGGSVKKEFSILANPINFIKKSSLTNAFMGSSVDSNRSSGSHHKLVKERQSSINNLSNNNNINLSDVSPESTSSEKIQELDNCNLIPINSSFNGNSSHLIDNLSINSYQSENSSEINFNNSHKIFDQNSPTSTNEIFQADNFHPNGPSKLKSDSMTKSSLMRGDSELEQTLLTHKIQSLKKSESLSAGASSSSLGENLNTNELREVALTMIARKEHMEEVNKTLKANLNDELAKNAGLADRLNLVEKELTNMKQFYESKLQNVENENKLLKDQLKKYVSAVQMIRSNSSKSVSIGNEASLKDNYVQPMPALNPNLQRDYSYEAEQYERKLIQVAEMHGELMEFNSRLHKIINYKTIQIEKLKNELINLRGPLPNELGLSSHMDDSLILEQDTMSIDTLNSPLISIWVPSAFLRTEKSGSHHVYQVYVRIKEEEWNIYRRFSHFHSLNSKLKEKYPVTVTVPFPKKKAIGNKDTKFVESRRKLLQDYLRKIINLILQIDRDLNSKPCKETLIKAIPFLSDQHFESNIQSSSNVQQNSLMNRNLSSAGGLNGSYGNSLGQMMRNNQSSSMVNGTPSSLTRQNELFYTGL